MKYTVEQIKNLIKLNRLDVFYNSHTWRKLAAEIKALNNNECIICKKNGKYSRAVIVHHVKHLRKHPELAYSRTYTSSDGTIHNQLIPVCIECHNALHNSSNSSSFNNKERW